MNTKLLLEIKKHILTHPKQLNMGTWMTKTNCGTTCCIAGWACLLSKELYANTNVWRFAEKILDIEGESDRLFHTEDWPTKYRNLYYDAGSSEARAKVTADRIQHYIDTGGLE